MPNYLIYIRKNNGICQKIAISSDSPLGLLKSKIRELSNTPDVEARLTSRVLNLSQLNDGLTLQQCGIPNNAILQIIPTLSVPQQQFAIFLQYGTHIQKQKIEPEINIGQLRQLASSVFDINANSIEFEIHKSKIFNDCVRLDELQVKNGDRVQVLQKKHIKNLLEPKDMNPSTPEIMSKMRFVESVASSDDLQDDFTSVDQRSFRKEYRSDIVKKKSEFRPASSLKKIEEEHEHQLVKRSAIVSSNMCSQFLNSPNVRHTNNLMNLNEIRETMSYGSLEDSCIEEIEIEIFSEDGQKYYKLLCMPECQGWQIRERLARAQRVPVDKILMGGLEQKGNISQASQEYKNGKQFSSESGNSSHNHQNIQLVFKILP